MKEQVHQMETKQLKEQTFLVS